MNWQKKLNPFRPFEVGDLVKFKNPNSCNAHYFDRGLRNLIIKELPDGYEKSFRIYESDKSTSWMVYPDEIEHEDYS